jgi:hypothetical protein
MVLKVNYNYYILVYPIYLSLELLSSNFVLCFCVYLVIVKTFILLFVFRLAAWYLCYYQVMQCLCIIN